MIPTGSNGPAAVEWARRVNGRWIVHQGLKERAAAYLDHLQATDHERLATSSEKARQMVRSCNPGEDPKPWFYAGLFSLVSAEEAARFLDGHWFTASCIPSLPDDFGARMRPAEVGPDTDAKLRRIRGVLAGPGMRQAGR